MKYILILAHRAKRKKYYYTVHLMDESANLRIYGRASTLTKAKSLARKAQQKVKKEFKLPYLPEIKYGLEVRR